MPDKLRWHFGFNLYHAVRETIQVGRRVELIESHWAALGRPHASQREDAKPLVQHWSPRSEQRRQPVILPELKIVGRLRKID